MVGFESIIRTLENWGVADVLLPFLLIFAVVFAVLEMTKIFGEDAQTGTRKNINVIVALVMGLAVVFPHVTRTYPPGKDIVVILNAFLPSVSLVLVMILALLILMGLFTGTRPDFSQSQGWSGGITIFMILVVVGIFLDAANFWNTPRWLWWLRDPGLQSSVIIIAVFWFLIAFITKRDNSSAPSGGNPGKQAIESLGKIFNGK